MDDAFASAVALASEDMEEHGLDTRGLACIPLLGTEPCTGFVKTSVPAIIGMTAENFTPGNLAKAAFLGPVFNIRMGLEEWRRQKCPLKEIVLTGGVLETPKSTALWSQLIADGLNIPVRVYAAESAKEGTAFGGALLMLYALREDRDQTLAEFLKAMLGGQKGKLYKPSPGSARVSKAMYRRHLELLQEVEPALIRTMP